MKRTRFRPGRRGIVAVWIRGARRERRRRAGRGEMPPGPCGGRRRRARHPWTVRAWRTRPVKAPRRGRGLSLDSVRNQNASSPPPRRPSRSGGRSHARRVAPAPGRERDGVPALPQPHHSCGPSRDGSREIEPVAGGTRPVRDLAAILDASVAAAGAPPVVALPTRPGRSTSTCRRDLHRIDGVTRARAAAWSAQSGAGDVAVAVVMVWRRCATRGGRNPRAATGALMALILDGMRPAPTPTDGPSRFGQNSAGRQARTRHRSLTVDEVSSGPREEGQQHPRAVPVAHQLADVERCTAAGRRDVERTSMPA